MSVLYNDVPFIAAIFLIVDQLWFKNKYMQRTWTTVSIRTTMAVEYKPNLLVLNYVPNIPWYFKYFLHKETHIKIFVKSALAKLYS